MMNEIMGFRLPLGDLLSMALSLSASDLHLAVGVPPAFRIDGDLKFAKEAEPLADADVRALAKELLTEEQLARVENEWELDFSLSFTAESGKRARFRGNCFIERGHLSIALRMIPFQAHSIDQLFLPRPLKDVAKRERGLFIVTGPTGSGKSTTLAAIVKEINDTRRCHIITIEDPIEYIFESAHSIISQREVGADTKSFASALKRVLRQDPDVIMVGEMRDLETISTTITAAETGHLVLSTLHTPDAAQTIDRIVDVFPANQQQQVRVQVSNILIGICSQQLLPVAGGGRIVATELLLATPAVRNCIREAKVGQTKTLIQTGRSSGMHTMDQDLARLVRDDVISYEVARVYAHDTKDLERLVFEIAANWPEGRG